MKHKLTLFNEYVLSRRKLTGLSVSVAGENHEGLLTEVQGTADPTQPKVTSQTPNITKQKQKQKKQKKNHILSQIMNSNWKH